MNNKHVACGIVIFLIICLAQGTLWMNRRMQKMQSDENKARQEANVASMQLMREQREFTELRTNSRSLIHYLDTWQPFFDQADSPQSAELKISLKIKEDNLVNLAQRYEVVPQKNNRSLPYLMRAHVTFEDDYARLLNWLGQIESQIPTMRVGSVRIAKGTGPNDLKMDLILEEPVKNAQ